MGDRPLFDPARMRARPGEEDREDRPISVSELSSKIDGAIKTGLPARVRVLGEISGLRERTHSYFNLKDRGAVIGAVVFASTARRLATRPADGLQVVATGRVDYYAPSGKVSLIVDRLEPVGAGPLEVKFRQLAEELRGLGWFDPETKLALPSFPRRVAVVTSRTGAALQDVLDTARRRAPFVDILVVDARVQGDAAVGEVSGAIRAIGARHAELGVDAIIVTRGGGSLEDLWAFNDRAVAEAIHACPVPVVAAIGHETDTTIAELVADERAATPTQAAMRLTPDRGALLEQLSAIRRRLNDSTRGRVRFSRELLRRFEERPVFRSPAGLTEAHARRVESLGEGIANATGGRVVRARSRVDRLGLRLERLRPSSRHARREERLVSLSERLGRVARRALDRERLDRVEASLRRGVRGRVLDAGLDLESLERELEAVSPTRVLDRGYSVTTDLDGRAVRDATALRGGQRVRTRVASGVFESEVVGGAGSGPERDRPAPGPEPSRATPPARRKRSDRGGRDQMDLFAGPG
ncbi:MAG: exodeoxyribonuclease VII large subunit [Phycisphaerales bacterium JB040]